MPLNVNRSSSRRGLCLGLRHELVDVRRRLVPLPERRRDDRLDDDDDRLFQHDGAKAQLHLEGAQLAEEDLRRQLLLQLEVIRRRQE